MRYLFDTNLGILILKKRAPAARERVAFPPPETFLTCSIVQAELWLGSLKYQDPVRRRNQVNAALFPYESLPFDAMAAEHYADIRHHLERRGEMIGPGDLKIAAICRAHGLILVTGNTTEFRRVPDLRLEDWGAPDA